MRSRYFFLLGAALALLLLAACSPAGAGSPIGKGAETPVIPTPYENQIPVPPAAVAAQQALAAQLGIPIDQIQIREIEQVQWPNACLGAAQPDEMCAMVIVDGFRIVMDVDGEVFTFHTNMDGSQLRMAQPGGPLGENPVPLAVERARQLLSEQLGIALNQVEVISAIPTQWPDSCLGVQNPDTACAEVITPGFRVVLQAEGQEYIFHTDQVGGAVIQAPAAMVEIIGTVLSWQHTEDNVCRMLEVGPEGVIFGPCDGSMDQADLPAGRLEELGELLGLYASFNAETPTGTVMLNSQGEQDASQAEQRSVAEWARPVYQEVEAGRSGAAWGMAFAWHREGGIAGFCDDLFVNLKWLGHAHHLPRRSAGSGAWPLETGAVGAALCLGRPV
jgi:hypothetical protein